VAHGQGLEALQVGALAPRKVTVTADATRFVFRPNEVQRHE
jgi:hypothetical protein